MYLVPGFVVEGWCNGGEGGFVGLRVVEWWERGVVGEVWGGGGGRRGDVGYRVEGSVRGGKGRAVKKGPNREEEGDDKKRGSGGR